MNRKPENALHDVLMVLYHGYGRVWVAVRLWWPRGPFAAPCLKYTVPTKLCVIKLYKFPFNLTYLFYV